MKLLNTIFLTVLFLLAVSCAKRKYPETIVQSDPEFYTSINVNGVSYKYSAGKDSYRMYSSYAQDCTGVYNFIAELRRPDCSGSCPGSFKIQINDFRVSSATDPIYVTQSLKPGKMDYKAAPQRVQFISLYNKPVESYLWDFGDGHTSTQANPVYTYNTKAKYRISLKVTSVNGCSSTMTFGQKIGFSDKAFYATITQGLATGNSIGFIGNAFNGKAPYSYLWNFGDGTLSNQQAPSHTYTYRGSYPVVLRTIDANADTAYTSFNAVTDTDISSCAANFSISSVSSVTSSVIRALSKVIITWTDESGTVFRSDNTVQPSSSLFEIVSVDDYDNNERGERTKKIKLRFNCILSSGSSSVTLDNIETTLCVAYK